MNLFKISALPLLMLAATFSPSIASADDAPIGLWEMLAYPKTADVTVAPVLTTDPAATTTTTTARKKTPTLKMAMLPIAPEDVVPPVRHHHSADYSTLPDGTAVMHICILADGTWHEQDFGFQKGQWIMVGGQVTLSGNDINVGGSGTLDIVQPNMTMSGMWQLWPVNDPRYDQDVYSSLWTLQSPTCN